jgi:serralysin
MPTLSNGSELTVLPTDGTMPHTAYYFTLTTPDGVVSEPFGALPDYVFGRVELASVDVLDGFFAITGFTHHGRTELTTEIDTYILDNEGNFIRKLSDEAAFLSAEIVSVEAQGPDDVVVTWNGANSYSSGENTQYGAHQIVLVDGVLQPDTFVNDAPELADLNIYLTAGQTVFNVAFLGSDADFDLLTFEVVDGPDHGTLELNTEISGNPYPFYQGNYIGSPHYHGSFWNNNQFQFSPDAGFTGTDSFTVLATDGQGNSRLATVTINVASPTEGPRYVALGDEADILRYFNYDQGVLVAAKGGDDDLSGSGFDDSLNGGSGNDLLHGETGNDKLTGGEGVDRMQGGLGNDTFIFYAGDIADPLQSDGSLDHIIDFCGAGGWTSEENDFISFFGFGEGATLSFDHYASDDGLLQIYRIDDPADPDNSGSIMVQMAENATQLGQGDFCFF